MAASSSSLKVNDRVNVIAHNKPGIVRFVGETQFASGLWVGIELEDASGKHNGMVNGVVYFTCADLRGIFVKPSAVKKDVIMPLLPVVAPSAKIPSRGLISSGVTLRKASVVTMSHDVAAALATNTHLSVATSAATSLNASVMLLTPEVLPSVTTMTYPSEAVRSGDMPSSTLTNESQVAMTQETGPAHSLDVSVPSVTLAAFPSLNSAQPNFISPPFTIGVTDSFVGLGSKPSETVAHFSRRRSNSLLASPTSAASFMTAIAGPIHTAAPSGIPIARHTSPGFVSRLVPLRSSLGAFTLPTAAEDEIETSTTDSYDLPGSPMRLQIKTIQSKTIDSLQQLMERKRTLQLQSSRKPASDSSTTISELPRGPSPALPAITDLPRGPSPALPALRLSVGPSVIDVIPDDTTDNKAIVAIGINVNQETLHQPTHKQLREWQETAQLAQKVAIDSALEANQQMHQEQIVQMKRNYEEQLDTAQHDLVTARTTALSDHEILRTELQRSKAIAADLKLAHRADLAELTLQQTTRDSDMARLELTKTTLEREILDWRARYDELQQNFESQNVDLELLREEKELTREEFVLSLNDDQQRVAGIIDQNTKLTDEYPPHSLHSALRRLRDLSVVEQQRTEQRAALLATELQTSDVLRAKIVTLELVPPQLKKALSEIEEYKIVLDEAQDNESMLEKLSMKNLNLQQKVDELNAERQHLSSVLATSEDIEEEHRELETQLTREVQLAELQLRDTQSQLVQRQQTVTSLEQTVRQFRQLAQRQQDDLQTLQEQLSHQSLDAAGHATRTRQMLDRNITLMSRLTELRSKAVQFELLKGDSEEGDRRMQFIQSYLASNVSLANPVHELLLLLARAQFKTRLAGRLLHEYYLSGGTEADMAGGEQRIYHQFEQSARHRDLLRFERSLDQLLQLIATDQLHELHYALDDLTDALTTLPQWLATHLSVSLNSYSLAQLRVCESSLETPISHAIVAIDYNATIKGTDVLGLGLLQVDLQQLQLSQASVALELRRLRGMLTSLTGMDRKQDGSVQDSALVSLSEELASSTETEDANSSTSSDIIVFLEGIRVTTLTRLEREFAMFVQLLSSFAAQLLRAEKLDRRVITTSSAADQIDPAIPVEDRVLVDYSDFAEELYLIKQHMQHIVTRVRTAYSTLAALHDANPQHLTLFQMPLEVLRPSLELAFSQDLITDLVELAGVTGSTHQLLQLASRGMTGLISHLASAMSPLSKLAKFVPSLTMPPFWQQHAEMNRQKMMDAQTFKMQLEDSQRQLSERSQQLFLITKQAREDQLKFDTQQQRLRQFEFLRATDESLQQRLEDSARQTAEQKLLLDQSTSDMQKAQKEINMLRQKSLLLQRPTQSDAPVPASPRNADLTRSKLLTLLNTDKRGQSSPALFPPVPASASTAIVVTGAVPVSTEEIDTLTRIVKLQRQQLISARFSAPNTTMSAWALAASLPPLILTSVNAVSPTDVVTPAMQQAAVSSFERSQLGMSMSRSMMSALPIDSSPGDSSVISSTSLAAGTVQQLQRQITELGRRTAEMKAGVRLVDLSTSVTARRHLETKRVHDTISLQRSMQQIQQQFNQYKTAPVSFAHAFSAPVAC